MTTLDLRTLTPDAFRASVIRPPERDEDTSGPGWRWWPPLARGETTAMVLLLEGTGRDDVSAVRFEDDPVGVRA